MSENFGMAARLLYDLKFKTVEFMYFDFYEHKLPDDLKPFLRYCDPSISQKGVCPYTVIFIPHTNKSRIDIKFDEFTPQEIMVFVKDNASEQIKLPDHKSLNKLQTKNTSTRVTKESDSEKEKSGQEIVDDL